MNKIKLGASLYVSANIPAFIVAPKALAHYPAPPHISELAKPFVETSYDIGRAVERTMRIEL